MVVCSILVTVGVFLGLYPMVVASLFIYHFMFNMGIGNIPWFYIAECTPKYAVGATAVLACSINWAIAVIFTLLTPVVENYIPLFSLLIFGVFALLGLVFVVLCVPETMKLRAIDVVRMHCGGFHLAIRRGRL
ncbi:Bifunctional purine biosynthesis protein PurH [Dipsacomyces acuminosporus]|nr:Bifunctional purine biosynthesis protein PurH [Dipsacomyces acuminosporus]